MELISEKDNIVKVDGEVIQLPLPIPQIIDIAYRVMKGDIISCEDLAKYCHISAREAMDIMLNPAIASMIHNLSIANAKLGFDATAFKNLLQIANGIDSKDADKISAIKALGDIIGYNESKKKGPTNVNINIENLVRNISDSPFKGF